MNKIPKRRIRLILATAIALLASVFFMGGVMAENKTSKKINAVFKEAIENAVPGTFDLRPVLPPSWTKICIDHLPYATQKSIEKKYQRELLGKHHYYDDDEFILLLFGLHEKNQLTEVALRADTSSALAKLNLPSHVCLDRDQAFLTVFHQNGKRFIGLGKID